MTSATTFGALLRQLRKRAGMTQRDFAAAVGYSISFVCDLEQNRRQPAVAVVLQQFIPALGLQEEVRFATQLVELAALMRGERPPDVTFQRTTQLVVTDTFTAAPWARLPAPPTELLGREHDVSLLVKRLRGHQGRLLTLVGPPGVGKTRLGLEVATRVQRLFKDGARFVPLAAVSDPELVATTMATELELPDNGKQAPQTRLIHGLRQKELLLVLDNFEQILAAAGLLATLLAECPGLHLLVTSRERLHLRAEQRYPVPPLDLGFAVALFVQQAQAVDLTFEPTAATTSTIAQICRRLDCLPLAIELIAARIDLFSPQSMLTRLQERRLDLLADGAQDVPERQRTLRTAIQYSYDLLAEHERRLFRTLGVFVDGFDLAAVAHFGFDAAALQALINKSLVHVATRSAPDNTDMVTERRFLLLETLREYAREQLTVNHEVDLVQRQHAVYYLQVAETGEPAIRSTQGAAWLGHLETEHNNLRAALTWALATGDSTTALRLGGTLQWLWSRHGHVQEGKQWLEKSLAISADAPLAVRAKALSASGRMDHILGNHVQAQTLVEQSLALYQTANDQQEIAGASLQLGGIHRKQHHYEQAEFFYQQSFNWFQAHEDKWGIAAVHIVFGHLAMNHNDYGKARAHYEQGLALQRELGDLRQITNVLAGLAAVAFQQGEYQRAVLYCEELLVFAKELGDSEDSVNALNELGRIALQQGEFAQATRYLTQSFALAQTLGYPPILALNLTYQGNLAFAQADLAQARQYYGQSLRMAHQLTEQLDIATGLESLAGVAGAQADAERTAILLGAAESLREVIDVPLPVSDQPHQQKLIITACTRLGETAYASAYAAGHTMNVDQAVAFALAQPTA